MNKLPVGLSNHILISVIVMEEEPGVSLIYISRETNVWLVTPLISHWRFHPLPGVEPSTGTTQHLLQTCPGLLLLLALA